MRPRQSYFTLATLAPVALLAGATLFGGVWIALALAYLTLFTAALDMIIAQGEDPNAPASEFPAADKLLICLGVAHFALLGLAVHALSGAATFSPLGRAGLFLAFVLYFGQVSNSAAHELIHRTQRLPFRLGKWIYISLLFGHHTSAHRLVHHRWVGCDEDPNTPALGESFYAFVPRAWVGSFTAGYEMERGRLSGQPPLLRMLRNPYATYVAGGLAFCGMALLIGGLAGLFTYLPLAFFSQMQLLQSDYVQHYGLRRARDADGEPLPVSALESWNSPHWASGLLMLHAPRHSDHHMHPATQYPALTLPPAEAAPMLPYPLPVMAALALAPRRFRRLMDTRAKAWHARSAEMPS
ncbi:alkane 1-monooxygenase [Pseudoruegeria sp. SHC-113]|uniref:alkane 1-monooxygenase n=1 Tax=Pseudoruegeria sp. SHC-113 TaxID=2855439 RepID=UPI0021BAB65A|nr:alkane 1-monooxygenase [Pseudoruegeria sp. SHC-113]MCT8159840.1 alkane 1-monooxygenase [Pseudoruegeria sp. SHC-113]